jgi:hypothetical protein
VLNNKKGENMRLFDIANDYIGLLDCELSAEEIADTLEGIEGAFEDKIDNICYVIAEHNALAEAAKVEIERLKKRKEQAEATVERLRDYVSLCMDKMEKKSVKTALHSVTLVAGRDVVNVEDEALIYPVFFNERITRSLDKKQLLEALKSGQAVEGASIGTSKPSLRIK